MSPVSRLSLIALLSLLLTAAALAQTDAFLTMHASSNHVATANRFPAGSTVDFLIDAGWSQAVAENVTVGIEVPGTLVSVTPPDATVACSNASPIRCTLSSREKNYQGTITVTTRQQQTGKYPAAAAIATTTPELESRNNHASFSIEIVDRPDLHFYGSLGPSYVEPKKNASARVTVYNFGRQAFHPKLTTTISAGGTFTDVRVYGTAECTLEPARVVCTADELGFFESFQVDLTVQAADTVDGGKIRIDSAASSDDPDLEPSDNANYLEASIIPHILVTSTADQGAGSLRQALLDARTRCETEPCTIDFRIAAPLEREHGWFTIRPVTPLPEIEGTVNLDGETQTGFGGDTNPDGPEIEINGSLLEDGHGLVLRSNCVNVFDLAINGFRGHAIQVDDDPSSNVCAGVYGNSYPYIEGNYLGTDPRGRTAVPNERGVVVSSTPGIFIEDNLISGNRRAGIFLGAGTYATVEKNRIGINANGEPLGNGASGVFLDVGGENWQNYGRGAHVEHNVIAYNGEWGVCRTPRGEIAITDNAIYGNLVSGIDVGLDFETPNRADDSRTIPNKPVLVSASYDPVNGTTTVRGRLDSNGVSGYGGWFRIDVYASSGLSVWGYPQGEEMVASRRLDAGGHTDFEITIPRDLRGKLITATNTRTHIVGWAKPLSHTSSVPGDTSEFSNAIEVR